MTLAPSDEELAAILAVLGAREAVPPSAAAAPVISPWALAGRFPPDDEWHRVF